MNTFRHSQTEKMQHPFLNLYPVILVSNEDKEYNYSFIIYIHDDFHSDKMDTFCECLPCPMVEPVTSGLEIRGFTCRVLSGKPVKYYAS